MVKSAREDIIGTKKETIIYLAIIIVAGVLLFYLLRDTRQTIAATIFLATVAGTLMFWRFRVAIGFLGLVLLLLTRTLTLSEAIAFMDLEIILFLVGMMVIIGQLRHAGFFRWFVAKGLKFCRYNAYLLMVAILVLAAVTAALVDEVTAILFVTALVLDLCDYFAVNPTKYIVSVILATNIGSSWIAQGNPMGIQIALSSGLTIGNFLQSALPVGVLSLLCLIPILLFWLRKDMRLFQEHIDFKHEGSMADFLDEWARIKDRRLFTGSVALLLVVVVLLIFDYWLEIWFGFETNTILVATSLGGAGIIKLWQRRHALEYLERDVDWRTLIFHMLLFAKTGGLLYVGFAENITTFTLNLARGYGTSIVIMVMIGISGFLSAALDNVVVVTQLIPVVKSLAAQLNTSTLWWALLFGAAYGGNLTMVGSTANIIALGELERRTGNYMTLGYWLKVGLFASLIPMAIAIGALLIFG